MEPNLSHANPPTRSFLARHPILFQCVAAICSMAILAPVAFALGRGSVPPAAVESLLSQGAPTASGDGGMLMPPSVREALALVGNAEFSTRGSVELLFHSASRWFVEGEVASPALLDDIATAWESAGLGVVRSGEAGSEVPGVIAWDSLGREYGATLDDRGLHLFCVEARAMIEIPLPPAFPLPPPANAEGIEFAVWDNSESGPANASLRYEVSWKDVGASLSRLEADGWSRPKRPMNETAPVGSLFFRDGQMLSVSVRALSESTVELVETLAN